MAPSTHANASCDTDAVEGWGEAYTPAKQQQHINRKATASRERYRCRKYGLNGELPPLRAVPSTPVHPRLGEGILFDQRIFHRGAVQLGGSSAHRERVSLQISFGRDDQYTREWSLGDLLRRQGMRREVRTAHHSQMKQHTNRESKGAGV